MLGPLELDFFVSIKSWLSSIPNLGLALDCFFVWCWYLGFKYLLVFEFEVWLIFLRWVLSRSMVSLKESLKRLPCDILVPPKKGTVELVLKALRLFSFFSLILSDFFKFSLFSSHFFFYFTTFFLEFSLVFSFSGDARILWCFIKKTDSYWSDEGNPYLVRYNN